MGFFRDAAFTAAGYGLHELLNGKKEKQVERKKSLEEVIDDYAHEHEIWGTNELLYQALLKIAEKYHDPDVTPDDLGKRGLA